MKLYQWIGWKSGVLLFTLLRERRLRGLGMWSNLVVQSEQHVIYRVRSAMPAASQLPGREPTDVDDAPASAC